MFSISLIGTPQGEPPNGPAGPYLGEPHPGSEPRLFAPGFISTGLEERDLVFSPDGQTCFFWVLSGNYTTILYSKQSNGVWSAPKVAPFSGQYADFEACFSADGQRLFFCSDRPLPGAAKRENDVNIWVMDVTAEGFSEPRVLGPLVNTGSIEFMPSLTTKGVLYFGRVSPDFSRYDVYRALPSQAGYTRVEKLPEIINGPSGADNPCISPDESFLIFQAYEKETPSHSFVSFRDNQGNWLKPVNLGPAFYSTKKQESVRVSPDGQFLFFSAARIPVEAGLFGRPSLFKGQRVEVKDLQRFHNQPGNGSRDIFWVSREILDGLRQ